VAVAGLHPLWLVADCDGRIFTPGNYDGRENRWDAGLIMVGERWLNVCWQRAFLAFEVLAPLRVAVGVGCFGETARWVRGYLEGVDGRFAKYPLTDSLAFCGEMGRACKFLGHPESGLVLSAPASERAKVWEVARRIEEAVSRNGNTVLLHEIEVWGEFGIPRYF
jgi:hypothetical protein